MVERLVVGETSEAEKTPVLTAAAIAQATLTKLPKGLLLHRVHQSRYRADEFNPGVLGNARFSPVRTLQGQPIPTLYAGTTLSCALMESVFHDVPYTAGLKTFDKSKLAGQVHSRLEILQALVVIDLTSLSLRKMGIRRRQLIDTEKDQYPATRQWAEALYCQYPDAQGLLWISRQDDTARALMLFGDRIPAGALVLQGTTRPLLGDTAVYAEVLELAARLGVAIIPGGCDKGVLL